METISLDKKIGSGGFRDCYEVLGHPTLCAKVLRSKRETRIKFPFFPIRINLPMFLTSLERFGRVDLNQLELEALSKLPEEIATYSLTDARLGRTSDKRSALITERPINYDGTYSETMENYGMISNPNFWKHMDRLVKIMKETDSQIVDMNPKNIVVKKVSVAEMIPIFIDIKRLSNQGSVQRRLLGRGRNLGERNSKLDENYRILKETYGATQLSLSA